MGPVVRVQTYGHSDPSSKSYGCTPVVLGVMMGRPSRRGTIIVWEACFHTTVTKFREAVIRTCIGIRKHYNHRRYTSLTGVVPEEERKRYAAVAKININGTYAITPALETTISRAAAAKARAMGS